MESDISSTNSSSMRRFKVCASVIVMDDADEDNPLSKFSVCHTFNIDDVNELQEKMRIAFEQHLLPKSAHFCTSQERYSPPLTQQAEEVEEVRVNRNSSAFPISRMLKRRAVQILYNNGRYKRRRCMEVVTHKKKDIPIPVSPSSSLRSVEKLQPVSIPLNPEDTVVNDPRHDEGDDPHENGVHSCSTSSYPSSDLEEVSGTHTNGKETTRHQEIVDLTQSDLPRKLHFGGADDELVVIEELDAGPICVSSPCKPSADSNGSPRKHQTLSFLHNRNVDLDFESSSQPDLTSHLTDEELVPQAKKVKKVVTAVIDLTFEPSDEENKDEIESSTLSDILDVSQHAEADQGVEILEPPPLIGSEVTGAPRSVEMQAEVREDELMFLSQDNSSETAEAGQENEILKAFTQIDSDVIGAPKGTDAIQCEAPENELRPLAESNVSEIAEPVEADQELDILEVPALFGFEVLGARSDTIPASSGNVQVEDVVHEERLSRFSPSDPEVAETDEGIENLETSVPQVSEVAPSMETNQEKETLQPSAQIDSEAPGGTGADTIPDTPESPRSVEMQPESYDHEITPPNEVPVQTGETMKSSEKLPLICSESASIGDERAVVIPVTPESHEEMPASPTQSDLSEVAQSTEANQPIEILSTEVIDIPNTSISPRSVGTSEDEHESFPQNDLSEVAVSVEVDQPIEIPSVIAIPATPISPRSVEAHEDEHGPVSPSGLSEASISAEADEPMEIPSGIDSEVIAIPDSPRSVQALFPSGPSEASVSVEVHQPMSAIVIPATPDSPRSVEAHEDEHRPLSPSGPSEASVSVEVHQPMSAIVIPATPDSPRSVEAHEDEHRPLSPSGPSEASVSVEVHQPMSAIAIPDTPDSPRSVEVQSEPHEDAGAGSAETSLPNPDVHFYSKSPSPTDLVLAASNTDAVKEVREDAGELLCSKAVTEPQTVQPLLLNCCFLLTGSKPHIWCTDSERRAAMMAMPFEKDALQQLIPQHGGTVVESITPDLVARSRAGLVKLYLIAGHYWTTIKYMQAIALGGVPCVQHLWLLRSVEAGTLLPIEPFLLPRGFTCRRSALIVTNSWPSGLFHDCHIAVLHFRPEAPGAGDQCRIMSELADVTASTGTEKWMWDFKQIFELAEAKVTLLEVAASPDTEKDSDLVRELDCVLKSLHPHVVTVAKGQKISAKLAEDLRGLGLCLIQKDSLVDMLVEADTSGLAC